MLMRKGPAGMRVSREHEARARARAETEKPLPKRGVETEGEKVRRVEERPRGRRYADCTIRPTNFGGTMENGSGEPLSMEICS